jgi:hypothetical protein
MDFFDSLVGCKKMSRNSSFHHLIQEIISIYKTLISEKVLSDDEKPNYIVDSINFLNDFYNISHFVVGNVSNQEIYHFLKLLLDIVGLVNATEGSMQPMKLGDTKLITRKRDLMGVYKGDDSNIDQNMCATLFQGWIKSKNPSFKISKDLRNIVPKDLQACDFLLESRTNHTLVECKRVHSVNEFIDTHDLITNIAKKSFYWIDESLSQFESAEKFLNESDNYRHVILDISAYGRNCISDFGDHSIVGLLETKEIIQLISIFEATEIVGIDEITFCWSELYMFEDKPRTFVYRTAPFKINKDTSSLFNYEGWTIEFYPSGKKTNEFKELRISSIARSQSWIKASWHSCIDNLVTFGPVETHE